MKCAFIAALTLASLCATADSSYAVRYARLVETAETSGKDDLDKLESAIRIYDKDGDLWHRLGVARYTAKKYSDAVAAYRRAYDLGGFDNKYRANCLYDIACCQALAGDRQSAFSSLESSLRIGFRDIEHVRTDSDLESLHADPRWTELAATKDASMMSREEGWRYDLWFLTREVQRIHYDAFKHFPKKEQDAWIRKVRRDIPKMSDNQIKVALMQYVRKIGDGHTGLRSANPDTVQTLPIQLYWFEEGVCVTAAAPEYAHLVGTRILRIAGKPVNEVAKTIDSITWQDNAQGLLFAAPIRMTQPFVLNGLGISPTDKEVAIDYMEASGLVKDVVVKAGLAKPNETWKTARPSAPEFAPLCLKNRDKNYWFEYLPDQKLVYFQYNAVQNIATEPVDKFAARLFDFIEKNDVTSLVVDVRFNGGGNTFLSRPLVNGIISSKKVNQRGHLFVITGRQTFSAAQNFSTDIGRACDAMYVGEPTGSSPNFVGETVMVTLPYSKMRASISDLYWQRSWPMDDRTWIAPDLPCPPTFEAFKANRDPAMEAVLEYLKG